MTLFYLFWLQHTETLWLVLFLCYRLISNDYGLSVLAAAHRNLVVTVAFVPYAHIQ